MYTCYIIRLYCIPTLGSSGAAGDVLKVLTLLNEKEKKKEKRRNYMAV